MADELTKAMTDLSRRLIALTAGDAGLSADLRALARAYLAATEGPPPSEQAEPAGSAEATPSATGPPSPEGDEPADPAGRIAAVEGPGPPRPLPELTFGRARPPEVEIPRDPRPAAPPRAATTDAELPDIEARCRLKAEGARWAAIRRRRQIEGVNHQSEIAPEDREIIARARELPDCFLWMNVPNFSTPPDLVLLEELAGCFEAVAGSVALARVILEDSEAHRDWFGKVLDVMAEAQSALRVAIGRVAGPVDVDQLRAYHWLRGTGEREQLYIRRHMKIDDPADPARLPEIAARIEALTARVRGARKQAKSRKKRLGLLRHKAKSIGEGSGGDYDWRKLAEAVDEMVADGAAPSGVEFREALLPILELMPDLGEVPRGFALTLREIDRFLAARAPSPEAQVAREPTAEVREAARLLAGRGALLIGGSRRPESEAALKTSLGIGELIWMETKEHQSIEDFEPLVAHPRVALVLLAIRWSSHSFGDVKRFCDRYGKPLVRLPAGYGPNQVAVQILAQCSEQLRAD